MLQAIELSKNRFSSHKWMHGWMDEWMSEWMNNWVNREKGKLYFMAECQLEVVGRIMELENCLATHMIKIASGKNSPWMLKLMSDEKQDIYRVSE